MFEGLIWAASTLMMTCNLTSGKIEDVGTSQNSLYMRVCEYRCQDFSKVTQNTNKEYQCPPILHEPTERPQPKSIYKGSGPNLWIKKEK
jgi:hypothetical protein